MRQCCFKQVLGRCVAKGTVLTMYFEKWDFATATYAACIVRERKSFLNLVLDVCYKLISGNSIVIVC